MHLSHFCRLPLLLGFALAGCTATPARTDYRAAEVQPVEVMPQRDGDVLIRYHVPAETLFHSPGADVRTASDGSLSTKADLTISVGGAATADAR